MQLSITGKGGRVRQVLLPEIVSRSSMDWLRSLGLEQYEAAFRENEIDDTVLPSLTAEDLKDL